MKKFLKCVLAVTLVAVMTIGAAPLSAFLGVDFSEINLFSLKANAETSGYYTYTVEGGKAKLYTLVMLSAVTLLSPQLSADIL